LLIPATVVLLDKANWWPSRLSRETPSPLVAPDAVALDLGTTGAVG
jgi:uncharacterized membrane protein YdfJ with MMPL/SSD domain